MSMFLWFCIDISGHIAVMYKYVVTKICEETMDFRYVEDSEYPVKDNLPLKVCVFHVSGIKIYKNEAIHAELLKCGEEFREKYDGKAVTEIPGVKDVRKLFHALGMDPTKRRPSSEALLRRALKNKEFYRVNNLVDLGNFISLKYQLPVCIYDSSKIVGDIEIRLGKPDDEYLALNHQVINFNERIVYSDSQGAFGSPMTDSVRTSITEGTTNAYCQILAPENISDEKLHEIREFFIEKVKEYCK